MEHQLIFLFARKCKFFRHRFLKVYQPKYIRSYVIPSSTLRIFNIALIMAGKNEKTNLPVVYRSLESVLHEFQNEKVTEYFRYIRRYN